MTYKPVGADDAGNLPPRVQARLDVASEAISEAVSAAAVEPVKPGMRLTNVAYAPVGQYRPIGLRKSDKALLAWKYDTKAIVVSTDDGAAWATLSTPPAGELADRSIRELRYLEDGEALAIVMDAGTTAGESLWRSSGWANPATATWTKVLQYGPKKSFWCGGLSLDRNIVLASEYGIHTDLAAQQGLAGAARAFLSTDYGATFSTAFDLNVTVPAGLASPIGGPTRHQHLHGSTYDRWWDRLWLCVGDGGGTIDPADEKCYVLYSDTGGNTWEVCPGSVSTTGVAQQVMPRAMETGIVFTSDFHPNAVWTIPREGFRKGGKFAPAHVFDDKPGIQFLGRHAWRTDLDSPLVMGIQGVLNTCPGMIVVTTDGSSFHTVWRDPETIAGGAEYSGLQRVFGPTNTGKIVAWIENPRAPIRGDGNGALMTGYLPLEQPSGLATRDGLARQSVRPGRYYAPVTATMTASYAQGTMRAAPLHLSDRGTIDRIGVRVQTAGEAGSKVRLGIYADLGGVPGRLLVDAGTVAGDSAGYKEVVIDVPARAGLYWLVAVPQLCPTTPPVLWCNGYSTLAPVGTTDGNLLAGNGLSAYSSGLNPTGALPVVWGESYGAGSGGSRAVVRVS